MCWGPSRATLGSPFNRPRLIRRQLRKGGSEHLLLQFMRKPSARSPVLGNFRATCAAEVPLARTATRVKPGRSRSRRLPYKKILSVVAVIKHAVDFFD